MKKVLQISKYMYPFIGGIEQVVRDTAHVLSERDDIQQKIICFNEDASDSHVECHKNETVHDMVDGVEVIRCGYLAKVASQSLSITYGSELKKIMNEFRPDIVIFHYPNPFVANLLLKYRKYDFKLIVYWHLDITKQKVLGKLFHSQNLRLINRADKIIGATPKHVDESAYSKYFAYKKAVVPYMINEKSLVISDEEIENAKQLREKYNGKILAFFIGRHVPYKGLKYLIEASHEMRDNNIHFFIAGKGELTESLMEQAKGDDKVEFIGKISDSQRRTYLYACDIFCFPSITRNEAFGLALAEGMYYGKPAVTFTIPGSGVNYVNLNGVTGIECPNGDSKAYAEALQTLCDNPKVRADYGENAKNYILNHFTTQKFSDNIWNLINSL